MKAEIITVGTELLLGDILNSNSQFLSRELAAFGIDMLYQSTVGDNNGRLEQVLKLALGRSELVLITGGLGPTPDDLTRETVCQLLGLDLQLHEESWRRIQDYFLTTGRELSDNNRKQAMLPPGCVVFPNDHGTAPGCAIEADGKSILLLPGPPRELIPMFQQYVAPYLSRLSGGTIYSCTIGVFGMPESTVAERLADLLFGTNPTVATYAKDGEVTLRVTAHAENTATARALCEPIVADIRERLGSFIYGVDAGSLQKTVITLLKEKGLQIATAESCTAGLLSGRLTEVAGASAVFECGIAAYSKEIKHNLLGVPRELLDEQGAVCADVACEMAIGARRISGAALGVGITGEAGPEPSESKPVGTVYIALADEKRVWVKEIRAGHTPAADAQYGSERDYVRYVATSHALDMTRRYLEALPAVMAGGQLIEDSAPPPAEIPAAHATHKWKLLPALFPWKGDRPVEVLRKLLLWVGIILLVAVSWLLLSRYVLNPERNREQYQGLEELYMRGDDVIYTDVESTAFPSGMLARFYSLYDQNPDIKGWVKIDGIDLSYPIVQNALLDYTTLNFERQHSDYGVPFFDDDVALSTPESVNRVYLVYGNNTGDGQMFSALTAYADASFLLQHPVIEMSTLYETADWEIFAVAYTAEEDDLPLRKTAFDSDDELLAFAETLAERSLFATSVELHGDDTLLLLTTDASAETGVDGVRIVVAARRLPNGQQATANLEVSRNPHAKTPEMLAGLTTTTVSTTQRPSSTTTTAKDSSDTLPAYTRSTTSAETTAADVTTAPTATAAPTTEHSAGETTTTVTTNQSGSVTTTTTSAADNTLPTDAEKAFYGTIQVKIGNGQAYAIEDREQLQYALTCLVKNEMGSARFMINSTEAQKAQAVACYTYMLWYCRNQSSVFPISAVSLDLNTTTDRKLYNAVGEVLGVKVMDTATGTPCNVMYYCCGNGASASSQNVFTGALPYLQSVESPFDTDAIVRKYSAGTESLISTYTVSWGSLKQQINAYVRQQTGGAVVEAQFDTDGDAPLYGVTFDQMGGYVVNTNAHYTYQGETMYLRGIDIRRIIGSSTLRSHYFTTAYDKAGDTLTFTVYGHGHGVGMSQYGAIGYANEAGWNYRQILNHYYSLSDTGRYRLVNPS